MKNILVQKLLGYLKQWLFSRSTQEFQSKPDNALTKNRNNFSSVQEHLPKVVGFLKKRFR